LFVRTGLTPREAKRKLTHRDASEFLYFATISPIDDRSNFQMPVAYLHSSLININADPKSGRKLSMQDCMLFKDQGEEEGHIDDLLLGEW
jgi:hypothetical protein